MTGGTLARTAAPVAWARAAWTTLLIGAAAFLAVELYLWWATGLAATLPSVWDFDTYRSATLDWLAGRGFYEQYQVAGPYVVSHREVLYPPTTLVVLVPFALAPAPLWWAVPVAVVAGTLRYWRPSLLGWALILACLAWPRSIEAILNGNPVIFATAALALGTRWPVFAAWVLLKPTFAPLGAVRIRTRAWWVGLALFAAVSLVLLPMWVDYLAVLRNATFPRGPLYTLEQLPLVAVPVIAWVLRAR